MYEGNWIDDLANGLGKFTYVDGRIYIGEIKDDMCHGLGQEHFPNKD